MNKKAKLVVFLFVLVLVLSSLAYSDGGGVQDTGKGIVDDILFETTRMEQDIQNVVDDTCNPAVNVTGCQHALP